MICVLKLDGIVYALYILKSNTMATDCCLDTNRRTYNFAVETKRAFKAS